MLVVGAGTLLFALAFFVAHVAAAPPIPLLLFVGTLFVGCSDAVFNTQIDTLVGHFFPYNSSPAFAIFYALQSLSSGLCFPLFIAFSAALPELLWFYTAQAATLVALLAAAFAALLALHRTHSVEATA